MKRIMTPLLIIAGLWFSADGLHELWARNQLNTSYAGRIVDENGVRAGCAPFEIGEGSTALILVHGFADSPALYTDMAGEFSEAGYSCRAIRLKGFAGPRDEQRTATAEQWKLQVIDEVQSVKEMHNHIFLLCHSLGSAVSLNAMTEIAADVDGLVLMAPLLEVSSARSPIGTPRFWFSFVQNTTVFTRHLVSVFESDTQNEAGATHPRETVLHTNIHCQSLESQDAALEAIKTITLPPTLMILAGKDQVVDNETSKRAFKEIKSERKEILWFKESGHVIPIDNQREDATKEIERFINTVQNLDKITGSSG